MQSRGLPCRANCVAAVAGDNGVGNAHYGYHPTLNGTGSTGDTRGHGLYHPIMDIILHLITTSLLSITIPPSLVNIISNRHIQSPSIVITTNNY